MKQNLKRELNYFTIGKSYGGNQRWMMDPWMHVGGCAALTTCDAFIYFALYKGKRNLLSYEPKTMTKKQYRKFGMEMRPYLRPRENGIKDLDTYMNGVKIYLEDVGEDGIGIKRIDGSQPYEIAYNAVKDSIDNDMPLAYLMLKHEDKEFDFFEWHWFLIIGYDKRQDGFYIKVATYGREYWLPFERLWNTGFDEKGGMVAFEMI